MALLRLLQPLARTLTLVSHGPKCSSCFLNRVKWRPFYCQFISPRQWRIKSVKCLRQFSFASGFGGVVIWRLLPAECELTTVPEQVFRIHPIPKVTQKESTYLGRVSRSFIEFVLTILRAIRLYLTFTPVLCLYPITYLGPRATNLWYQFFRLAVESSGATFIKLGQWVSTRRDLFPDDFCQQLAQLQRRAPAHGWGSTRQRLRRAFGGRRWRDILVKINRVPQGSGAVAQAHKAWIKPDTIPDEDLLNTILEEQDENDTDVDPFEIVKFHNWGSSEDDSDDANEVKGSKDVEDTEGLIPVCVKVLHPGIYSTVTRDLRLLMAVAWIIEFAVPSLRWLSVTDCIEEFSHIMLGQLDLRQEAAQLEKFASNFDNVPFVKFPRPIWPYIRRDVLVETWEEATPISTFLREDTEVENVVAVRSKLANIGIDALLKMVFVDNLVHGDLHPGNIMVQNVDQFSPQEEVKLNVVDLLDTLIVNVKPVECPLRLVFLDVGIATVLEEEDRRNFKKVFTAVVCGDGATVAELMLKHSEYNECADIDKFKGQMADLVNEARKESLMLGKFQVGELLSKVFHLLMAHKVKMQSNFVSIILAIMVLEGLGRSLDPELDILEKAKPILLGGYR